MSVAAGEACKEVWIKYVILYILKKCYIFVINSSIVLDENYYS